MLTLQAPLPVDFDPGAAQILSVQVLARLDALDHAAGQLTRSPASEARMRAELARLVRMYRTLLARHHPDGSGRCPRCRRRWIGRRRRWPCPVWQLAHDCLVGSC